MQDHPHGKQESKTIHDAKSTQHSKNISDVDMDGRATGRQASRHVDSIFCEFWIHRAEQNGVLGLGVESR